MGEITRVEFKDLILYIDTSSGWQFEISIMMAIIILLLLILLIQAMVKYIRKHNPYLIKRIREIKENRKKKREKKKEKL